MLIVEIHVSGTPIIYRAAKPLWLIGKKKRAKYYKFACIAQMLQRLKFYEYDYEDQMRKSLIRN